MIFVGIYNDAELCMFLTTCNNGMQVEQLTVLLKIDWIEIHWALEGQQGTKKSLFCDICDLLISLASLQVPVDITMNRLYSLEKNRAAPSRIPEMYKKLVNFPIYSRDLICWRVMVGLRAGHMNEKKKKKKQKSQDAQEILLFPIPVTAVNVAFWLWVYNDVEFW